MRHRKLTCFQQIVLGHLRQVKGGLCLAAFSIIGLTLTDLLRPWPLKIIFDHILLDQPLPSFLVFLHGVLRSGKVLAVVVVSFSIVLIALLGGVFSYTQVYVTSRISNQLVYTLRRELFAHLQRLSLSFHNRARSGELLTKIASDTNTVKEVAAESALTFTSQLLIVIGVFAIMFALNWKLAVIVLATVPFLLGNLLFRYRRARASAKRQRKKEEKIASHLNEVLTTALLVQAFGREKYEQERFGAESAGYLEENIRNARIEAMALRAVEITNAVGTGAVVLFGSLQVLAGQMTLGSVLIFTSYLNSLYRPMRNLTKPLTRFSKASVSAGRINEVLEVEPEVQDAPEAITASGLKGEIVFENVSFGYANGKRALRNVSFVISPGQQVALLGASGAGKSTVVSLILRLYDPQEGRILIDGVNIKKYQRESLRREIAIVLQDSLLLGTTIRENIGYGKLDATMEEIVAAAQAANAHDFITELDARYETIVGERGDTLSGGQRRRIAIARAFVRDAPILILDEPMAGVDVENEANIREALKRLAIGRTSMLITHDLRAAAYADLRVLIVEDGRVIEQGTHRDLMRRSSRYRRLYHLKVDQQEAPTYAMEKL